MAIIGKNCSETPNHAGQRPCACGCKLYPMGKRSRFIQGHDAALKGKLLRHAGGTDPDTAARATTALLTLGWYTAETLEKALAARTASALDEIDMDGLL